MELGTKFDFATVVEQLCTKIKSQGKKDFGSEGKYKHRDKWQKLATSLPQAVLTCMEGNVRGVVSISFHNSLKQ